MILFGLRNDLGNVESVRLDVVVVVASADYAGEVGGVQPVHVWSAHLLFGLGDYLELRDGVKFCPLEVTFKEIRMTVGPAVRGKVLLNGLELGGVIAQVPQRRLVVSIGVGAEDTGALLAMMVQLRHEC